MHSRQNHPQPHQPRMNLSLLPAFYRSLSKEKQDPQIPLPLEQNLEAPLILGPEVLVTSGQGPETLLPSGKNSEASLPLVTSPNLISFLEPKFETFLFPKEKLLIVLPPE